MNIGVPRETLDDEYRVALTPAGTGELAAAGHSVLVEKGAGEGSAFSDSAYGAAGAVVVPDAQALYERATLIVKVKAPRDDEISLLESQHVLFAFLDLAAAPALTKGLLASGATCVAYETVQALDGRLPLLAPMSEIAGRLAPQIGAYFLQRMSGGKGKLLGGVTGVKAGNVVILGAGVAGSNAALIASGMGAHTKVLDIDLDKLSDLQRVLPQVETLQSNRLTVREEVAKADLLIGAVQVPGTKAPVLVGEETVKSMQPGSVVVDLSIDQGGCVATSRMTTHRDPTYTAHGVIHYCVGNMPGVVAITSTLALTNATLPYVMSIAQKGMVAAARADAALARGINIMEGKVTVEGVARATGNPYFPLEYVLPIEYT